MAAKGLKESFGIEAEGKDLNGIFEAYGQKVLADAKIEPNKKIQELQNSLSSLQSTYQTDISQKDQEINGFKTQLNDFSINQKLMSELPDNLGIAPKHFLTIARSDMSFDFDDNGGIVAKQNGQIVKDKLEKPVPVKDLLSTFAQENGFVGQGRGGRGGGGYTVPNVNTGDFESLHDVYKHMYDNKIDPMSPEGDALVNNFKQSNG
jgi:ribosomal protein S13